MTERGRVRVEPANKRVRVMAGGTIIADTITPLLVWEVPHYPTYYLPISDVATDHLVANGANERSPSRGTATLYDLEVGGRRAEAAAYAYLEPKIAELADHVAIRWDAADHWFEEDDEVFVHARDPFTRIDILSSSRRVRVQIDGVTVADSTNASFLHETGLPVRYYLPKTDVDFSLLAESDTETHCPYKGTARYWSVSVDGTTHPDIVWGYDYPVPESQKISGLVSFYNEKVDIYIDEELQERPKTKFG